MVAPGFRSRIATGLLVASVVLPVPLGATSAVAADRRATPVDRPSNLARQDDPHDGGGGDDYGADDFGPDGYGDDDLAPGPSPGRARHGHSGPSARELPDRIPGLPYALPGFPHRSPHHHPGGRRGYGEWRHHPHQPFGPDFPGPVPPFGLPGPDDGGGGGDLSWRGHHGPPGPPGPPGADRAHSRPGRHAPRKHHRPAESASRAAPAGSDASRRHHVADRRPVRSSESLPPLPPVVPKKQGGSVPDGADGEAAASGPYALETPAAPVERVLPLGAGLTLTGLGLAFFALRLRRS